MAQPPAVVIIARHGARLDAADKNWILSTPTPYDPPLTYAGWNQSRALGVRIASLLHAREQEVNSLSGDGAESVSSGSRKRKRRAHKVVIHSSPFLRCLQTSVAISAGMAHFEPVSESASEVVNGGGSHGHLRAASSMHSASPKMRAMEATRKSTPPSIVLTPLVEPKADLIKAAGSLGSCPPHRKSKLRVDAFLGEWMNPQYFDYITPPPPSNMMVAGAKAELMQNEALDVFTPSNASKGTSGNLWGGMVRNKSRESLIDDWSDVRDSLPAPRPRRDRASSYASYNSADSADRRSPFRPGHVLQPLTSTLPKQKQGPSVYVPPTPAYAVSGSDHIPRGYLAHARAATVDVDYQWDSSRVPQNWGDGAELGEEWSAMHNRFRRGINSMVRWYGKHGADARAEDALGLEQVEGQQEEEEEEVEHEDLVVILVTHGAGCNALIGALTGQPVLIDVATSSLTMATLRQDAPSMPTSATAEPSPTTHSPTATPRHSPQPPSFDTPASLPRRNSLEASLAPYYQMQITASTDHLRSGASPARLSSLPTSRSITPNPSSYRPLSGTGTPLNPTWQALPDYKMGTQSAALGSIRRPPPTSAPLARPPLRSSTLPGSGTDHETSQPGLFAPTPPLMHLSGSSTPTSTGLWTPPLTGLWTPPAARTPVLAAKRDVETSAGTKSSLFSKLEQTANGRQDSGDDMVLDFSNSPPDSRPGTSSGPGSSQDASRGMDSVVDAGQK
nr:hypothetical protein B0A51_10830 [Rachicladosporium sp. CCFEE 5018]